MRHHDFSLEPQTLHSAWHIRGIRGLCIDLVDFPTVEAVAESALQECVVSGRVDFNISSFPSLNSRRLCWPHLAFCELGRLSQPPETPQTTPTGMPGMAASIRDICQQHWDSRSNHRAKMAVGEKSESPLYFHSPQRVNHLMELRVSYTPLGLKSSQDLQQ